MSFNELHVCFSLVALLTHHPVTTSEMVNTIKTLDHTKRTGDFSIPNQVSHCIPLGLAKILTKIINKSFETGTFPNSLKIVKVIPIFKNKGSNQVTNNYRPISLLSNIDKILKN